MSERQSTAAHLRIAHSIGEQIMVSHFSEQQRRILDLILRLSWGCNKKTACIPKQRDFEVVGIREGHIKAHLDWLIAAKVIIREGSYYAINEDFDQWRVSRALEYGPQKLTQLISLNLQAEDPELTPSGSSDLPKTEENLYAKGKSAEPASVSSKERLNKYINKNNRFIDISSGQALEIERTFPQEAREIWRQVQAELRLQVSAANYRTWLEKTAGLGYHCQDFIVGVNNRLTAEYLQSNLRSLLEKTLIGVSHQEFKISFVEPAKESS